LGNEGNGLSDFSRQNAHNTISLPMANNFESLNVSVAGSVIMYQIYANTK
ncbi:MAG: RNA methyltransferase, partial [Clostridia bacterium]|nr:RNA methyltransferase [Clostridia bacterium]